MVDRMDYCFTARVKVLQSGGCLQCFVEQIGSYTRIGKRGPLTLWRFALSLGDSNQS